MNGLQAVTQNFVAAQTYPGATPQLGFVAPMLYQLGNSANYDSYYRDIECGNTANPTSGPDGDAATQGWDAATGWGEPDWFNFTTAYAMQLGATNLSVPASLSPALRVDLREDAEQLDRARVLVPDDLDLLRRRRGLGRHAVVRQVPHRRRLGRGQHVLQEHRRRRELVPVEQRHVLDRVHEREHLHRGRCGRPRAADDRRRRHVDGRRDGAGNNKPLTQVTCPAQLDLLRGRRSRQRDEVDRRRPDAGRGCKHRRQPDLRALVPDARRSATRPTSTPTSSRRPTAARPGRGRRRRSRRRAPNVAGLRRAEPVRRPDGDLVLRRQHVRRVGPLRRPERPDDPEHRSADRHDDRRRRDLDASDEQRRHRQLPARASRACPGTTTCTAVGRGGKIVTTTDLARGRPRRRTRRTC